MILLSCCQTHRDLNWRKGLWEKLSKIGLLKEGRWLSTGYSAQISTTNGQRLMVNLHWQWPRPRPMTLGSMGLCKGFHTAQRQITTQIPIEFCILVIRLGLCLSLGHCQCKCTINQLNFWCKNLLVHFLFQDQFASFFGATSAAWTDLDICLPLHWPQFHSDIYLSIHHL